MRQKEGFSGKKPFFLWLPEAAAMHFILPELEAYAEAHTSPETDLLRRLNRDTHAKVVAPRMLSGHLQGRLLALLSKMLRPRHVLEIGTYTGYSALCLAEGLTEGGRVLTIDNNPELEPFFRPFWEASGLAGRIDFRLGEALALLPTLDTAFDLVFLDADKRNYLAYYEAVLPLLRPGGFLLADNVLWSGKILHEAARMDADTAAVAAFNARVAADDRVEKVLLPLRDGLYLIRKKD